MTTAGSSALSAKHERDGNARLRLLQFSDIDREDGDPRPRWGNRFKGAALKPLLDIDIACDNKKAALVLFSMEAEPRQDSLSYLLNSALQAPQRDLMKPWEDYLCCS